MSSVVDHGDSLNEIDNMVSLIETARDEVIEALDTLANLRGWIEDTSVSEHVGEAADELDAHVDTVEAGGPDEGESSEHHEAYVEGLRAAVEWLRDQYV